MLALPFLTLFAAAGIAADLPNKEALDQAIRAYLLEHPEVIVESLEKYEQRERSAREQAASTAMVSRKNDLFNHPMTPTTGDAKADITIVEFFDYQCGYCKRAMQTVLEIQKEDPRLRIAWKELPILGPASEFAARAAMAAKRQDKYLDFHVAVMSNRPGRIKEIIDIDLERPRHYDMVASPRFQQLHRAVLDSIRAESIEVAQLGTALA